MYQTELRMGEGIWCPWAPKWCEELVAGPQRGWRGRGVPGTRGGVGEGPGRS